jgi:hypothetical protein
LRLQLTQNLRGLVAHGRLREVYARAVTRVLCLGVGLKAAQIVSLFVR